MLADQRPGARGGGDYAAAHVHDQPLLPLVEALGGETIVLADTGFHSAKGIAANLTVCPRGSWTERIILELVPSMVAMACGLKHVLHRTHRYVQARSAYVAALFTALLMLNRSLRPDTEPDEYRLHIAQYAL